MQSALHTLAKILEALGLVVILGGVMLSVKLGMQDDTMKSMSSEAYGLAIGAGLFGLGYLIERSIGTR